MQIRDSRLLILCIISKKLFSTFVFYILVLLYRQNFFNRITFIYSINIFLAGKFKSCLFKRFRTKFLAIRRLFPQFDHLLLTKIDFLDGQIQQTNSVWRLKTNDDRFIDVFNAWDVLLSCSRYIFNHESKTSFIYYVLYQN